MRHADVRCGSTAKISHDSTIVQATVLYSAYCLIVKRYPVLRPRVACGGRGLRALHMHALIISLRGQMVRSLHRCSVSYAIAPLV